MPPGKKTKNTLACVLTVANVLGTCQRYHWPLLVYRFVDGGNSRRLPKWARSSECWLFQVTGHVTDVDRSSAPTDPASPGYRVNKQNMASTVDLVPLATKVHYITGYD